MASPSLATFRQSVSDYLLLLVVGGLLFFPNLGRHSLWDVDESHNAECAREMIEADDWCIPSFNYTLRTDKPVLLYWLIMFAYQWLGVSEFAARFFSAACGLGSLLVTYELGRALFDRRTGLLAGLVLGSAIMFCVSAHAATPDALLIFFTLCTFLLFWLGYRSQNANWLVWIGVSTGLAVLAKGPVGILLPASAIGLFLIWEGRLRVLLTPRLLLGLIVFAAVALPWYILVGVETKWRFYWDQTTGQGFFLKHHVGRFLHPLERHGGPIVYHPLVLLAGFAPWSAFFGLAVWYATGRRTSESPSHPLTPSPPHASYRFLWCWLGVWLVFFSLAGTKLPNYLLPAYPAVALLTARFLVRWRAGEIVMSSRWINVSLICLGMIGVMIAAGLILLSGAAPLIPLRGRELPGLAPWGLIGLVLPAGAVAAWWCLRRGRRDWLLPIVTTACVGGVAILAGFGPPAVDQHKVPRFLAEAIAQHQVEPEIQIGCHDFYQPALVFYTQQRVRRLDHSPQEAIDLLHSPLQTFLVVPAETWQHLQPQVDTHRVIARRRDFASGKEILLVTNRLAPVLAKE
jgi:4-amino-4-deoxy-L-arabinose transferase-like glycosyltransferase